MNIDLYPLICSVLHLNLDPKYQPTDRYCLMDARASRVRKMLVPIKYTSDDGSESSEEKPVNSKDDSWFGSKMKGYF